MSSFKRACPWILLLAAAAVGQAKERSPLLGKWFRLPAEPHVYTATPAPQGLHVALLSPRSQRLSNPITNEGATLGRVLFYDQRLSRNSRTSCASCHKQVRAFADFRSKSPGLHGRLTKRNSMGLSNLGFHVGQGFFWDDRAETLEETVLMPIQDPIEMNMDLDTLVTRLRQDTGYLDLFRRAFGSPRITADRIGKALAQFIRSMASFQSKFDKGYAQAALFRDPFPNFSELENRGKRLFGQACASCHMQETRRGVAKAPVLFRAQPACNGVDRGLKRDDQGLAGVTNSPDDAGKFRIPTLRNIELTAPYMHDGRFASLDQVVEFYATRVRAHPNLDRRLVGRGRTGWGQSMPQCRPVTPGGGRAATTGRRNEAIGFPMTRRDRKALTAFLRTLTDRQFIKDPRFADPFKAGLPRR